MRRHLALALVVLSALSACARPRAAGLPELAPTPVLGVGPGWLVVEGAYARVKSSPSFQASDVSFLRAGDVVEALGRERSVSGRPEDGGVWFRVRIDQAEGWIHESLATLYENRAQALKAAESGR